MRIIAGKRPVLVKERPGPCFKATAYLVDVPSGARIGRFFAYGPTHTVSGIVEIAGSMEAAKQRKGVECTDIELFFLPESPVPVKEHEIVLFEFVPPFDAVDDSDL